MVNDSRGFFTSRVFGTFVMEGAAMLGEGIPAPVIEHAGIQAGMPVGPLAVLDETALSLSVHVLDQTRADYRAEGGTYIASPGELLVERMVKEFDRNGRAAGGGFYDYPRKRARRSTSGRELKHLFEKPGVAWDMQDLKDRLLYRQAVETARCLAENVLTTRARRQHRLDLRHRLSGLDRRRAAVHLRHGHRRLLRARRAAGGQVRPGLRAHGAGQGRHPRAPAPVLSGAGCIEPRKERP